MKNNNFMKQYSTIKSDEDYERENEEREREHLAQRALIAKKVCDYWKNRIFTETDLNLTDDEKSEIQGVFQELETEIKKSQQYSDLSEHYDATIDDATTINDLSEHYVATINDFDIINRINRRINKGEYIERDIISHIDNLTGNEITMKISLDCVYTINHRPFIKKTANEGYEPWYTISGNEPIQSYEYLYCAPSAIKREFEVLEKLEKFGLLWAKTQAEALKNYEEKNATRQEDVK